MIVRGIAAVLMAAALSAGCGGGSAPAEPANPAAGPGPAPPPVADVAPRAVTLATGLAHPWGLAFLPDGSMLVTERGGALRLIPAGGGTPSAPLAGLPPVLAAGQGGLLDVAVDPDFTTDPWIYWTYAEPGSGLDAGRAGTALARGRLVGAAVHDVQVLYRQMPKVTGSNHFGARIAFAPDKTLFLTLGDRQRDDPAAPGPAWAQNAAVGQGKVLRLQRDGQPAAGTPAVAGGAPGLWSLGHRNPQGAAVNPASGELWLVEHGPQGGDELNRVRAGANFGWPWVSYGCAYGAPVGDACRVGGGTHAPAYDEPLQTWVPTSTAPSGMAFYTAERLPQWRGSLFVGALAGRVLWRLTLDGDRVSGREALFGELGKRIRDVRQGPDGLLYLLTDAPAPDGRLIRIEPQG